MTPRFHSTEAADRLIETDPFDFSEENCALFVESFRETATHHYGGSPVFRAFWNAAGIRPEEVSSEADLRRAPPLMVHLFKERELRSVSINEIALTLTSSGTGGEKSRQFLTNRSLGRVKKLAFRIHESLGLTSSSGEVNYVCFTYDPGIAKDLGTVFTDELLTSFTPKAEVYYAFQWDESRDDFVFNEEGTISALKRFEKEGKPVRVLGFPAFLYQLIQKNQLKLNLGRDSWVQTGGGWKGLAEKEIPKSAFRGMVSDALGISENNIRDMFGMVEHGIPYLDCRKGKMHIPNYARVWTRSPDGRVILPEGDPGLLQLLCTYNDGYPAISLLTTDWGRVGSCDCGLSGGTLELIGRAGVSKQKGCAIKAAEMLG